MTREFIQKDHIGNVRARWFADQFKDGAARLEVQAFSAHGYYLAHRSGEWRLPVERVDQVFEQLTTMD
jgi:hypothetical protein